MILCKRGEQRRLGKDWSSLRSKQAKTEKSRKEPAGWKSRTLPLANSLRLTPPEPRPETGDRRLWQTLRHKISLFACHPPVSAPVTHSAR